MEQASFEVAASFNSDAFYANLLPSLIPPTSFEPVSNNIPTILPLDEENNEITQVTDFEQNNTTFAALSDLSQTSSKITIGGKQTVGENLLLESLEGNTKTSVMASTFIELDDEINLLKPNINEATLECIQIPTQLIQSPFVGDNALSLEPKTTTQISSSFPLTHPEENPLKEESMRFLTSENEQKDFFSEIKTDSVDKKPLLPNILLSKVATNIKPVDTLSNQVLNIDKKSPLSDLLQDNMALSNNSDNTLKAISELSTSEPEQNITPYDIMLGNVADFLNKKLTVTDPYVSKSKSNVTLINGDLFSNQENKSALKGFQFNASGIAASLKVEGYSAKIKVYPHDLGQITAEILLNKGVTELTLRVDNPQVKHFIETNLQQLRESFQNTNVHLGDISVQDNLMQSKNEFQREESPAVYSDLNRPSNSSNENQGVSAPRPQSNSLIDTYA
jgi:flagellar hook-length control protein FliK